MRGWTRIVDTWETTSGMWLAGIGMSAGVGGASLEGGLGKIGECLSGVFLALFGELLISSVTFFTGSKEK